MNAATVTQRVTTVEPSIDGAVGVPDRHWFVAIVKHNTERRGAERLTNLGIETYLPTQAGISIRKNGQKVKTTRVVIPSTIFVRCTEEQRRQIVALPFIHRFMTDRAGKTTGALHSPLATIPDIEIERLRFMLGQSDTPVTIAAKPFRIGDKVRVIRGSLLGLEGEVLDLNSDRPDLYVLLPHLGHARLSIPRTSLQSITS